MGRVPSKIYSREYYLTINDGGALGDQSLELSPRLEYMQRLSKLNKKDTVLDVGCGSGELCLAIAGDVQQVVGIDYSKDGIVLCEEYKKRLPKKQQQKITFIQADVSDLQKKMKGTYSVVFMNDVVEHLYPDELDNTLAAIKKLLAPGGRLYIHTAPNLNFYRWGYPVIRTLYPIIRHVPAVQGIIDTKPNWKGKKRLPKDPEEGSHNKKGHVNEQTPKALRKTLEKHGYRADVKILPFLRDVHGWKTRLMFTALSVPIIKQMFSAEIISIAEVPQ